MTQKQEIVKLLNAKGNKYVLFKNVISAAKNLDNCTVLIPSMEQMNKINEISKTDKTEAKAILLSHIVSKKDTDSWDNNMTASRKCLRTNVTRNGTTVNKNPIHKVSNGIWQLEGKEPLKASETNKTVVTASFENKKAEELKEVLEIEKKVSANIKREILKRGCNLETFKKLVLEIYYNCLDEENKEIANFLIVGNPVAEFFVLFDSPFIKLNSIEKLGQETSDSVAEDYEKLVTCPKKCCDGNMKVREEIRSKILENLSAEENTVKNFYEKICGTGKYEDTYICPITISEHLFSLELFYGIVAKLAENLSEKSQTEFLEFLREVVNLNFSSNIKSLSNEIFEENDDFEYLNILEERFKTYGLSIFCETKVDGNKEHKKISKKFYKAKKKIAKLSEVDKINLAKLFN